MKGSEHKHPMATAAMVGFPDIAGPDTVTDGEAMAKSDTTHVGPVPLPSANSNKLFAIGHGGILG